MEGALALRLLALGLAVRLMLAAWLPLGIDEAYAIAVARQFSWSFFDHPPIGFWLPVAAAWLTGIEAAFVYRLPFVALGTLTAWAIWQIGTLWSPRAGLWALILFHLAPHMMFGSALLVVPDAPLNAGGAVAILLALRALRGGHGALWLGAGLAMALALSSKYQAALLGLGLLGYLITTRPGHAALRKPWVWMGAGVALSGLLPVLIWAVETDWVSFRFQGARTGGAFNLENLLAMSAGQAAYLLPPVLALALVGLARVQGGALLRWAALPVILAFGAVYAFGTDTLPHWTMPGWLFALPLAGVVMAGAGRVWRGALWSFALPVWALIAALALHLPTGLLARGAPQWDRQLEMVSLRGLDRALTDGGWLDGIVAIAVPDWRAGGQVGTALGGAFPVAVLGPDARHFAFHSLPEGPRLLVRLRHAASPPASPPAQPFGRSGQVTLMRGSEPHLTLDLFVLD